LRDYTDDTLRFCLDDGAGLIEKFATQPSNQPTVSFMGNQTLAEGGIGARTVASSPSNAGRILGLIAMLLGLGSWLFMIVGVIASASSVESSIVGVLILISIPGACLGMLLGLIGLYRAFRTADRKGAKKTAILSVLINLLFLLGLAALMVLGLAGTMLK
jgi:hypothetical protein